ncbi:MAG: hypothetical protein WBI29_02710 [Candidatus Saccharimonadales bacterium]
MARIIDKKISRLKADIRYIKKYGVPRKKKLKSIIKPPFKKIYYKLASKPIIGRLMRTILLIIKLPHLDDKINQLQVSNDVLRKKIETIMKGSNNK